MAQQIELSNTVKESQLGQRLDQAVAELFADFSRSRIKEWLLDGKVQVDGVVVTKPRTKVMGGEVITVQAELEDEERFEPQDIPLDIVFEDDDIIVINNRVILLFTQVLVHQMVQYSMHYCTTTRKLQKCLVLVLFTVLIKTQPA